MRQYPVPCRQSREKRFKVAPALLEAGESEALIFTKVDRASRCTEDFARLLRLSGEQGRDGVHQPKDLGPRAVAPGRGFALDGPEKPGTSTNSRGLIHDRRDPLCQPISRPPSPSIASVDTYLRFAEAVNRDLTENGTKPTELLEDS
jgi:hypothetical protein